MDQPFVFLGNVPNDTQKTSTKVRKDERVVTIRQSNVLLTSIGNGSILNVVDKRGKGQLMSIKVVTDNPYIQVLLEIDDWRNEVETPAGLLYGGTARQNYGLYAVEGGDPAKGYTVMYAPMRPESFDKKLRIVLRNRLPKTRIYGNNTSFKSSIGTIPINNGFSGGHSFSAPLLAGASLTDLTNAMAQPHFGDFYNAPVFNSAILGDTSLTPGIDHPFVGQAGKPTLTEDSQAVTGGTAAADNTIFFSEPTGTFPNTTQVIYVANLKDNSSATALSTGVSVGDRLFIRDGGTLHFPGEVTAVGAFAGDLNAVTTEFTNINNVAHRAITVAPGLQVAPTSVQAGLSGGATANFGTISTAADTDPKILIKAIEVKYRLEVSYDG